MKVPNPAPLYAIALLFALTCLAPSPVIAQDATQAPAGGIVSLDDAPLTIVKQRIVISPDRVLVDYTLRNDTAEEISTDLAFLVPEYTLEFDRDAHGRQGFDDVQIAVDTQAAALSTDTRAELHGRDVTATLLRYNLDIASFGHFSREKTDLAALSQDQVNRLVALGLYLRSASMDKDPLPRWSVSKRYITRQSFAPGVPVRVQLNYAPVPGMVNSIVDHRVTGEAAAAGAFDPAAALEMRRVCTTPELQARLRKFIATPPHNAGILYVDFSLMGEHAWKSPIADFSLQIVTPPPSGGVNFEPSICWAQSEVHTDRNMWSAHVTDFTPNHDLRAGWFEFEGSDF